jgi:hypothetical protein
MVNIMWACAVSAARAGSARSLEMAVEESIGGHGAHRLEGFDTRGDEMRYLTMAALAAALATGPGLSAQEAPGPVRGGEEAARLAPQAPLGARVALTPVQVAAEEPAAAVSVREPSARTFLAVIGAVLLVVALVTLLT